MRERTPAADRRSARRPIGLADLRRVGVDDRQGRTVYDGVGRVVERVERAMDAASRDAVFPGAPAPDRPAAARQERPYHSQTVSSLTTPYGSILIRTRRWVYVGWIYQEGDALRGGGRRRGVITTYTVEAAVSKPGTGRRTWTRLSDDYSAPEFGSHLEAVLWGMDYVEACLARAEERRRRSERARAALPPAASAWESLRRLFHKRGVEIERRTGWAWGHHRDEIRRRHGVGSSNDLTEEQLRAEIERMEQLLTDQAEVSA